MRRALRAAIPQKFMSAEELAKAICSKNAAKFCDVSGMLPEIVKVCQNFAELPQDVKSSTSLRTVCAADFHKMCYDTAVAPMICPDGKLSKSMCKLYPSKCEEGTADFDECAKNIFECAVKPEWDFCQSFEDLCFFTGAGTGSIRRKL